MFDKEDIADQKLFSDVSQDIWTRKTYAIFYHLLDNYVCTTGVCEEVSQREQQEMTDFLDACMETKPMQYCFQYLVAKVRRCSNWPHPNSPNPYLTNTSM